MTDSVRLLLSVDSKIIAKIDNIVKTINEDKTRAYWQSKSNRQGLINSLVKFALEQDVSYSRGYGKSITVEHKKK